MKKLKKGESYLLTMCEDWADEHDVPALDVFSQEEFDSWCKCKHNPNARLGNNGDGFLEEYQGQTGKDFIKAGIVNVTVVPKEFVKYFHKAELSSLSLSNIFENCYDEE